MWRVFGDNSREKRQDRSGAEAEKSPARSVHASRTEQPERSNTEKIADQDQFELPAQAKILPRFFFGFAVTIYDHWTSGLQHTHHSTNMAYLFSKQQDPTQAATRTACSKLSNNAALVVNELAREPAQGLMHVAVSVV